MRARADLALAKGALTGLLLEGAPGASPDDEPLDQRAPHSLSPPRAGAGASPRAPASLLYRSNLKPEP